MSQDQQNQKPKSTAPPKPNVLPIVNRIVIRRSDATRRAILDPNNADCHIFGDDFAMVTSDSTRRVNLVRTGFDAQTGKDVVIDDQGPILKNASVKVDRVAVADDHNGTSSHFLTLINDKGEHRPVVYTARKFKDGSFINQLAGHTVATGIKKRWDRLPEFIEELTQGQRPAPLLQIAKRAYGWHQLSNGDHVFLLENGCETPTGFVDATAAPLFLDTDGSFGYTGAQAGKPVDDVMKLLLCKLNPHPSFDAILFALIGTGCHVSFIESKGVAPTVLEIYASMRLGKSAVVDITNHLFTCSVPALGTGAWQLPPVFNDVEDTAKGQGHLRAMFRYLPFQLPDLKAMDETTDVKNDNRIKTNESYGDVLSAGVTSSIDQVARSRKARAGAPIRTGEEDYAVNSIKRKKGSAEFRANSFLWPHSQECERDGCGCKLERNADGFIQSDEAISRELAKRRPELYAWGFAYRQWQMKMTKAQREKTYAKCLSEAESFIAEHWPIKEDGGLHSGFATYIIAGVNLWLEFLRAQHRRSFQIEWLEVRREDFLNNRLARTQWLIEQIRGNRQMTFSELVIDIIRRLLLNGDYFIADHRGEALENRDDLPVGMIDLGYAPNGNGNYRQKKIILGYLSINRQFISFQSEDFYRVLLANAQADGHRIPLKNTAWATLCDAMVAMRPKADKRKTDGHRWKTAIGKKREWCIRVPVSKIWDIGDGDEESDDDSGDR